MNPSPSNTAVRDPALEARLKQAFQGCCFGGAIHAYAVCDSTMERAHALAREGAGEGTLVFAARQEQGRGRLGRRWESPEGGAYFSLILKPTRPPAEAPQLSLVAGLSTAEAIRELTGLSPSIRWPNDILIDGKKVAGILVEAKNSAVVVGVGINVTTDPKDLPETAASLEKMVPGSERTRGAWHLFSLVAAVCRTFDGWYDTWTAQGFAPIRQALRPWIGHFGQAVRISASSAEFEGTVSDLDESGRLVVRFDSGILRAFEVGEVTMMR